ncbi:hypothetical protein WJ07_24630 [Burkholderia vietnamiensis]|nr:hypothetical protein WJ07_24630 [Burkholderia vietnamiensis]
MTKRPGLLQFDHQSVHLISKLSRLPYKLFAHIQQPRLVTLRRQPQFGKPPFIMSSIFAQGRDVRGSTLRLLTSFRDLLGLLAR